MSATEFLLELVSIVNFPVTLMMGIVLAYWSLVIVGVLGFDAFDIDFGVDGDVDFDLDGGIVHGEGCLATALGFLHLGEVPIMILGSVIMMFLWTSTVATNFMFNADRQIGMAFLMAIPNLLVSLLLTKLVIWPFIRLGKATPLPIETRQDMIGLKGTVKTSIVTDQVGQVEIQIDGPEIVINARVFNEPPLRKGDCAKIISYNNENDTFTVSLCKWEKE